MTRAFSLFFPFFTLFFLFHPFFYFFPFSSFFPFFIFFIILSLPFNYFGAYHLLFSYNEGHLLLLHFCMFVIVFSIFFCVYLCDCGHVFVWACVLWSHTVATVACNLQCVVRNPSGAFFWSMDWTLTAFHRKPLPASHHSLLLIV